MKRKVNKKPRQTKYGYKLPFKISGPAQFIISSNGTNDLQTSIRTLNGEEHDLILSRRDVFYEGKTKEKIILSQPITDGLDQFNCEQLELMKYDLVVVIDTSYRWIDDIKYASTCWLICEKDKTSVNGYGIITYEYNWIATDEDKPENIMYANVIDKVEKHRKDNELDTEIAVVVDSDLNLLDEFNRREAPIYADFYLPEKWAMFYSNSERGTTEYFENKLMQMCDKEAKESLDAFIQEMNANN